MVSNVSNVVIGTNGFSFCNLCTTAEADSSWKCSSSSSSCNPTPPLHFHPYPTPFFTHQIDRDREYSFLEQSNLSCFHLLLLLLFVTIIQEERSSGLREREREQFERALVASATLQSVFALLSLSLLESTMPQACDKQSCWYPSLHTTGDEVSDDSSQCHRWLLLAPVSSLTSSQSVSQSTTDFSLVWVCVSAQWGAQPKHQNQQKSTLQALKCKLSV